MHSIADLTTFCRKTTGDVPPNLVGASTTIVGTKMYLFGGRTVTGRRIVSDLYIFDLELFKWEKVESHPEENVPARYFHSVNSWNNQLVIFGGMGSKINSANPDDLRALNDVHFFDIPTRHWIPIPSNTNSRTPGTDSASPIPKARYAHLSSITADRLFIIGGQDLSNVWLDDIYIYDLLRKTWVQRRDYPRHCGAYRSVAVAADTCVRMPQDDLLRSSKQGTPNTRFRSDKSTPESTTPDSLVHLPYSTQPSQEFPSNIYLYSNYNFTDVKRELEVFSPLPSADFTINDRTSAMGGVSLPPGLRFPTGAVLGTHLIIAGTYMAHTCQSFSIWALDLLTMTWSRIDLGNTVSSGSWFRGCLWTDANKFLIFGNRNGNLVDDYNRCVLSWDHVAVVDLEAFGIYQAPPLILDIRMQELGLAALEEDLLTDFEVICDDDRIVRCSRKVLEDRWPWFRDQRVEFLQNAKVSLKALPTSSKHVPLTDIQGKPSSEGDRIDPRLTPRSFKLSEPYPITLALIQYFYTMALITPLQHAPAVLSQLLVLSNTYQIQHLQSLVKHAMHRALSNSTSAGVYEVATVCGCRSLQIRALKTVMAYSQRRPPGRMRRDTESSGGSGPPSGAGASQGAGRDNSSTPRARGISDNLRHRFDSQNGGLYSHPGNFLNIGVTATDQKPIGLSATETSSPCFTDSPSPRRPSRSHAESAEPVSTTIDSKIRSLTDRLPPVVIETRNPVNEYANDEGDSVITPLRHLRLDIPNIIPRRGPSTDLESPYSPQSSPSLLTSVSDVEAWPANWQARGQHPNDAASYSHLHVPVRRGLHSYTNDSSGTPSLVSSASYSPLSTTSWVGRQRYAPASSPISLPSMREALAEPHLAIADEQHSGEYYLDHWHHGLAGSSGTFASVQTTKDQLRGRLHVGDGLLLRPQTSAAIDTTNTIPHSDLRAFSHGLSQHDTRSPIATSTGPSAPSTPISKAQASSKSFSRYGGRGLRYVKQAKKPPKLPKGNPPTQTTAETLWEESQIHLPLNKKTRKAEAKKRMKAIAKARADFFAADSDARIS